MQKQSFGELLRTFREANGISLRSLAVAADMDPAYLSRLENGKTGEPRQETVEKLSQGLCAEAGLGADACGQLGRQLLEAAGHLQPKEELLDDLAERFAARLRQHGLTDSHIDAVLARVPLATMRAVLLGEEPLDVVMVSDVYANDLKIHKPLMAAFSMKGFPRESDLSFDDLSMSDSKPDSAAHYLERHAADFASNRRQRRQQLREQTTRVFRAGTSARIEVESPISREQEQQLRLIARLVASVLQEK